METYKNLQALIAALEKRIEDPKNSDEYKAALLKCLDSLRELRKFW